MKDEYIRKQDVKDALQEKVFHNLTDEFYGAMQVLDELEPADVISKADMITLLEEAKREVKDGMDDEEIIRQELEQKCWLPSEMDEAAKRLNNLIFDINPAEICSQIESDNLTNWCKTMQVEMKMAMVQLPCWSGKE